jgi:predicted dehydrogenase
MTQNQPNSAPSRRDVIKTTAIATAAMAAPLIIPKSVHAAGSDLLKVGLIGCGGRGTGAAQQALNADKNVALTAIGDAFQDQIDRALPTLQASNGEKVKVTKETQFVGFDAYQKVLDSGVDVVILTTPPGFRPMHLKAAVAAGKHIFCEKPVAVDGPGVRSVFETVEESKKKKLNLVSGLCWRYHYGHRDTFAKLHDGAIGDIMATYSRYNTGGLWMKTRKPEWSDMEWQVRNWLYFTWLSGDHIVEQAVHTLDKMAWAFKDVPPVKCLGAGGRQQRTDPAYGHIYDHFSVVYDYANGARGFFYCRQQEGTEGGVFDDFYGTKGTCAINSGGPRFEIKGENPWRWDGEKNNMYQTEHDEMFAAIRKGETINNGERMTKSTLLAVMGRMSAYTGKSITWDQALNSQENTMPEKLEWGPLPTPPVAIPGKSRFM